MQASRLSIDLPIIDFINWAFQISIFRHIGTFKSLSVTTGENFILYVSQMKISITLFYPIYKCKQSFYVFYLVGL